MFVKMTRAAATVGEMKYIIAVGSFLNPLDFLKGFGFLSVFPRLEESYSKSNFLKVL